MKTQPLYLWRDYMLTKKQLKEILSKDEWKDYWDVKRCKLCKVKRLYDWL